MWKIYKVNMKFPIALNGKINVRKYASDRKGFKIQREQE